jgi:hypothetical protein
MNQVYLWMVSFNYGAEKYPLKITKTKPKPEELQAEEEKIYQDCSDIGLCVYVDSFILGE